MISNIQLMDLHRKYRGCLATLKIVPDFSMPRGKVNVKHIFKSLFGEVLLEEPLLVMAM